MLSSSNIMTMAFFYPEILIFTDFLRKNKIAELASDNKFEHQLLYGSGLFFSALHFII